MKGRKSLETAEFLEKRFNDTVSRPAAWAGYGRGATEEPFCLSSLGKAAQNLLVPSCSMVLHSQTSADGSPGNTSEHNMSADVHKKRREKMRRSSSTLISCSSNFSNSKGVSMNGTWTWPEFCFPCHVAFLGEAVRAISGCHPAWGQGRCQGSRKQLSAFLTWVLKAS